MNLLRTLKKLVLGETWILPLGIASTLAATALIRSLAISAWPLISGLTLITGVVVVLIASVSRTARRRR